MVTEAKEKKKAGMKKLEVPRMEPGANRKALMEKSREIAKAMWPGKMTVNEKAALNHICLMYGLDPLLREVIFLGGNFYIVVSGMVKIANRDKDAPLAGINLRPATMEERALIGVKDDKIYLWHCEVWKKGIEKPFVEWGEASADDVNLHGKKVKDIRAMARTRAKGRALKEAYSISLPIYEEGDLSHKYPEAIEVPGKEVKEEPKKEEKKAEKPPEQGEGGPYKVRLERAARFKNLLGVKTYYAVLSGYKAKHANEIKDLKVFDQFLLTCEKVYNGKKEEK